MEDLEGLREERIDGPRTEEELEATRGRERNIIRKAYGIDVTRSAEKEAKRPLESLRVAAET